MDLSDLIDRNAAFAPDKTAIRFAGRDADLCGLRRPHRRGRARAEVAARRRPRRSRRDPVASTIPTIWCCSMPARGSARCWCRSTGGSRSAEQVFILSDARSRRWWSSRPSRGQSALAGGAARRAHRRPRLRAGRARHSSSCWPPAAATAAIRTSISPARCSIVYTSGTTGRPKGAVLRQEALVWNAVMSQHMHDMTSDDHVLTVLPLLPRRRAQHPDHAGAAARRDRDASMRASRPMRRWPRIARDRPTLTVLVPATMQALIEHPRWAATDLSSLRAVTTGSTQVPQRLIDAFTARGVPVLQVYGSTETCPIAVYTPARRRSVPRAARPACPASCCEARVVDEAGREVPPGTPGEVVVRGPNVFFEYWGNEAATARGAARRLVSYRRHRHARCRRLFLSSTTARRT